MPGTGDAPFVLVSNRGPVTFEDDGTVRRGTGGLVTALTGLASHRHAVWVGSSSPFQSPGSCCSSAVLPSAAAARE